MYIGSVNEQPKALRIVELFDRRAPFEKEMHADTVSLNAHRA